MTLIYFMKEFVKGGARGNYFYLHCKISLIIFRNARKYNVPSWYVHDFFLMSYKKASDGSGWQKSGSGRVGFLIFLSGSGRVRVANIGFGSGFGLDFGV